MVKVVDRPFRSMGEQGMDQHLYMADMPRVFDKTFFSALDHHRNLHNIDENSGWHSWHSAHEMDKKICVTNYAELSSLVRFDSG